MEKNERCCICGNDIEGYGYNPFPVKEKGQCCRKCNYTVVLPERFRRMEEDQTEDADWREHMRIDIANLLCCGYIFMLKGWELSKGAKLELDVASSCGIKVLFEM